jgi:hypothetical protein
MKADFKDRVRQALDAKVVIGDGHTLFSPEFYAPYFTLDEIGHLITKHKSDGTGKGSIFAPDGSVVDELEAIYNLEFLYWLARHMGITTSVWREGRGSQAQELVGYILEELEK